jgi:subtilisin family serine protease
MREPTIHQMIVKLRNPKAMELVQPLGAERVAALSTRAGVSMRAHRAMSGGASVLRLDTPLKLSDAKAVAARIAVDPDVLYAEPDMPVRPFQTVPPDASYTVREWHFFAPSDVYTDRALNGMGNKQVTPTGAANLPGAWSITQGSAAIVVALVDSGVTLNHPELASALLPGWDFVSGNAGGLPTNLRRPRARYADRQLLARDAHGRDHRRPVGQRRGNQSTSRNFDRRHRAERAVGPGSRTWQVRRYIVGRR